MMVTLLLIWFRRCFMFVQFPQKFLTDDLANRLDLLFRPVLQICIPMTTFCVSRLWVGLYFISDVGSVIKIGSPLCRTQNSYSLSIKLLILSFSPFIIWISSSCRFLYSFIYSLSGLLFLLSKNWKLFSSVITLWISRVYSFYLNAL